MLCAYNYDDDDGLLLLHLYDVKCIAIVLSVAYRPPRTLASYRMYAIYPIFLIILKSYHYHISIIKDIYIPLSKICKIAILFIKSLSLTTKARYHRKN